jgi:uncharacterized membrane protein YgcG
MKRKTRHPIKQVKVPVLWLACSWICMILLGLFLFVFILNRSGVSFPLVAGQSTDPYFFAALASILAPLILQIVIVKILRGIIMKHSSAEIAKEVGKDVAITIAEVAVITVVDAFVGGSGSNDSQSSSSGEETGARGNFGGGGASGGY